MIIEELIVPELVLVGTNTQLTCKYNLQGEQLYAIKWYKGGQEFYRVVPSDRPKIKKFQVDGIKLGVRNLFSIIKTKNKVDVPVYGTYLREALFLKQLFL